MNLEESLQRRWYGNPRWLWLLLPLELLFRLVTALRRLLYRRGILRSWRAPVPVLVIGNISVGGTGKTPVTIALCAALQQAGLRPGVISRGYRARPPQFPHRVSADDRAAVAGDEPLLIARRTGCPVAIAPERSAAAQLLLQHDHCDVLICDDGLQHYALQRDIEVAVVDAVRGFGNRHCLPVGPLREPLARLRTVDAILFNGGTVSDPLNRRFAFPLEASAFVNLHSDASIPAAQWRQHYPRVHALAGIGNPARFFRTLRELGCDVIEHAFPDHHEFSVSDVQFGDGLPVVMTEKDAVKCAAFASERHWALRVDAVLPEPLLTLLLARLRSKSP